MLDYLRIWDWGLESWEMWVNGEGWGRAGQGSLVDRV